MFDLIENAFILQESKDAKTVELYHYSDWKGDTAGETNDVIQLAGVVMTSQARAVQNTKKSAVPPPYVVQCK
jgi:hypothetical protein